MDSFAELGPLVRDAARWRSLGALLSLAAASALAGALVACGGGGGGGEAPAPPPAPVPAPAPAPGPSSAPIAAQLTVPTPVGYDADRLAAFNRLNEIRLSEPTGRIRTGLSHIDDDRHRDACRHVPHASDPDIDRLKGQHKRPVISRIDQ